ncbi:MAG: FAD-binding oxidoreductase [Cyclobacteriaceae bacterium]|nr:FAD-binding oxidoreductase [Cyclobacteriaceae bacterium]
MSVNKRPKIKNLQKAIKAWILIVSESRVITDLEKLQSVNTATFKTVQKVHAIVKPVNSREVSEVVKVAFKNSIPIYPVSGGKNWGLGSKVPQRDGVLLDLSLMDKVLDFNESMAYMTVQPGVTFGDGVEYLARKKSSLMLDTIGSTPEASIVGNTAERGHGMALYADRFNYVCGLEVVLPNGEIIETGFENYEDSKLGPLAKWGLGPYIDGLFTQSNLGIITKLTLWLRPQSQHFQSFIFNIDKEKDLTLLFEEWRKMVLEGFNASLRIFNDVRMISFGERMPDVSKPLTEKGLVELRTKHNVGKWIGMGATYPISELHREADKAFIISRVGGLVDNISFYDQKMVDEQYKKGDDATKARLDFLFNKSLLRGNVSKAGIGMLYWRKPKKIEIRDIHQDRCGVLWYCPTVPFTGKDVIKAITISKQISKKRGFELNIGFLFISQRALDITGAICYDRDVPGEDERAMECHNEIMDAMVKLGYSPYRLGIQSMKLMSNKTAGSKKLLKVLKEAIDTKHILAPGHYIN